MIVYSNGCSHTAGACVSRRETYPHAFMDYVTSPLGVKRADEWEYFILPHYNTIQHQEDILNHKGDHLLVFHAHHGKSNDKIYYETIDTILRMISIGKKPDYALIQWSGPNRKLFTSEPGNDDRDINSQIFSSTPHDYTEQGLYFEPFASKHTLQLMISLQDFLIKHDVEYVFIPYMELIQVPTMIELDSLDLTKLTVDPFKGHRNIFRYEGLSGDVHGHPNELGNYFILVQILRILNLEEFDKGMSFWSDWSIKKITNFWEYQGGRYSIVKKLWNKLEDATSSTISDLLDEFKELRILIRKENGDLEVHDEEHKKMI